MSEPKDTEADVSERLAELELEVDQLKDAVEYYKKKSEEESPSALHAELHRLRRACRHALATVHASESRARLGSRSAPSNKYARVMRAMGKGSSNPAVRENYMESIARCLLSALEDAPPRRRVVSGKEGSVDE